MSENKTPREMARDLAERYGYDYALTVRETIKSQLQKVFNQALSNDWMLRPYQETERLVVTKYGADIYGMALYGICNDYHRLSIMATQGDKYAIVALATPEQRLAACLMCVAEADA